MMQSRPTNTNTASSSSPVGVGSSAGAAGAAVRGGVRSFVSEAVRPWLDVGLAARNGTLTPNIAVDGDVATLTLGQTGIPPFVTKDGKPVQGSSGPTFEAVALRYAWQDFPDCVLRNGEGFPAVPFRVSLLPSPVE